MYCFFKLAICDFYRRKNCSFYSEMNGIMTAEDWNVGNRGIVAYNGLCSRVYKNSQEGTILNIHGGGQFLRT